MKRDNILLTIYICIILLIITLCNSCMSVKTNVGGFKEQQGKMYVYSKSKQVWLFWGMAPIGRTQIATPANGQCQVIVKNNVFDIIISGVTSGFIKSQTIKVIAKK